VSVAEQIGASPGRIGIPEPGGSRCKLELLDEFPYRQLGESQRADNSMDDLPCCTSVAVRTCSSDVPPTRAAQKAGKRCNSRAVLKMWATEAAIGRTGLTGVVDLLFLLLLAAAYCNSRVISLGITEDA
jgi:hypothetical protein